MSDYVNQRDEEFTAQVSVVLISLETAVWAFVDSIAHVFGVESGSYIHRAGNVHMIHHAADVLHHYPREFVFRREFVALGTSPQETLENVQVSLAHPTEDHVLYVFDRDIDQQISAYEALGYQHAWNNALLAVRVDDARVPLASGYFMIRELERTADVAAYERLGGPTGVGHTLFDAHIHSFVSYDHQGEALARSQLVTKVNQIAYVSGMFTEPRYRRRGVGSGLMNAMHRRARREGAEHCILVPSKMATDINFYPRFGYEVVAPHAVFIPRLDG